MLLERLTEDMKEAMKARDTLRVSVLRMTLSEAKNARIEKGADLTDDEMILVVMRAFKKREEAVAEFRPAGRADLADKEAQEAAILKEYLPRMLEGEELREAVLTAIRESNAQSSKDLGKVMKALMAAYPGRLDGKAVQGLVRERLGG